MGRLFAAVAIGAIGAAGPPALVELDAAHDRRRAALVATFALSLSCGIAPFLERRAGGDDLHGLRDAVPRERRIVLGLAPVAPGVRSGDATRGCAGAAHAGQPKLDASERRIFGAERR